ncbi:hypothetical protein R1sor_022649 [Riccia sorocarpa]|uniref:CCHC-type domain-containing protein n=1 Tax=Riccia sorocarpa TaxID=122646 RepID=A0ABD3GKG1_9MARC
MDRPPCFLDGRVIRMLEWDAKANDKIPPHLCAAWVELRGVPPCLEDEITVMLEALGPVIHQTLDKSEEVKYANVRACVEMAVELPKAVGIVTPWKTKLLQAVTYTRLPDRCYVCHLSGHMARQCPTKQVIPTSGVMGANATRGEVAKQSGGSVSSKEVPSSKDKEEADGFEVVRRKGSSQLNKGRSAVASPTRSASNRFNALADVEEEIESDASWVADSSLNKREDKLEATEGHKPVLISPVKVRLSQEPIVDHNWVRKLELLRKQEEVVQAMEQEVSVLHADLEAHRRKEGEQENLGRTVQERSGIEVGALRCNWSKVEWSETQKENTVPMKDSDVNPFSWGHPDELSAVNQLGLLGDVQFSSKMDVDRLGGRSPKMKDDRTMADGFGKRSARSKGKHKSGLPKDVLASGAFTGNRMGKRRALAEVDLKGCRVPEKMDNFLKIYDGRINRTRKSREDGLCQCVSWNVRGLARPNKAKAVKSWLQNRVTDRQVVALQEIKTARWGLKRWLDNVCRRGKVIFDPPCGGRGGTALILHESLEVVTSGIGGQGRLA